MGLLDTIKSLFGGKKPEMPPVSFEQNNEVDVARGSINDIEESNDDEEAFDTAGFSPHNADAFFEAVLHMESEGQFGGTDESRARIMQEFSIKDRSHWQVVKDSMYQTLAQKMGSFENVMQAESNWRTGNMQKAMQGNIAARAASGELNPVEGISLEQWAAYNAGIAGGINTDDLLKANGLSVDKWQRVSAEWNARMARDTTFAITQVYGNAFQAASQGKYGQYAREANAARTANRDLTLQPPMPLEQYFDVLFAQDFGTRAGKNPVEVLKSAGLTVVDWTDLGAYYGYWVIRNHPHKWNEISATMERSRKKYEAQYPGVKSDLDIAF